jgi:hypothetical protein
MARIREVRLRRRLGTLGLAGLLLLPSSGCASRSGWGWEAGMMGAMVVGGLVFGRGLMHSGSAMHQPAAMPRDTGDVDRFDPARLLAHRQMLELSDGQAAALGSLRQEVAVGRLSRAQAASAAYALLGPERRAAVPPGPPGVRPHH